MPAEHRVLGAAAICCVAFVAVQLAWMRDPCGSSLDADIAAGYTLYSCRAAASLPLAVHQGHMSLLARAEGQVFVPYLHHPPLGQWLMQLIHSHENGVVALRAGAAVLSALALLLLWRGVAQSDATRAALALGLCAGCGAWMAFGSGASPPLFGLPFMLAALWAWRSRSFSFAYVVCAFLAGLADWNAYGVVPALWWGIAMERPSRPWRSVLAATLPWVLAASCVLGHMALGAREAGGLGSVLENVSASLGLQGRSIAQLLVDLAGECAALYGWPLLLLSGIGAVVLFVRAAAGRMNTTDQFSIQCWIFAVVPCALFLSRSATHPFWVIILAPALALSAAVALQCVTQLPLAQRWTRCAQWLLPLVLVGLMAFGISTALEVQRARSSPVQEDRARLIEQLVAAEDVLLFADYSSAFACRALTDRCVVVRMESRAMLARAATALRPSANSRTPIRKVLYALPLTAATEMRWLLLEPGLVLRGSARKIPWPGGTELLLLELDTARFMALAG